MFLELLRKEFISRKESLPNQKGMLVLSYAIKGLFLAFFVYLECFLSLSIDKKIEEYSRYGSYDFLLLFLFVFFLMSLFFTTFKARGVLYDRKDHSISSPLPLSPSSVILAKVTYLYIESSLFLEILCFPLFVCYGVQRHFVPYYYIFSFLSPFFLSFSVCGIALFFSLGYEKLYEFLKKNILFQFLFAVLLMLACCFLYEFLLRLFLTALSDSSIGGMFSESFVSTLHKLVNFFFLIYQQCDILIGKTNLLSDICIFFGLSLLLVVIGLGSVSLFYNRMLKEEKEEKSYHLGKKIVVSKPVPALLKKEFSLLFLDENNLFSYTSLLILCPFLTYAVLSSLNDIIYDNLRFYASYFPELVNGINLTLILLFSNAINSSVSNSMKREGKALKIVKTIPVSIKDQLFCKILPPFVCGFVSLLLTCIVLLSTSVITVFVFFSSLGIGTLLLLISDVFGIYCDMHDSSAYKRRKISFINDLFTLVYPFFLFFVFFLFSLLFKAKGFVLYLSCFLLTLVLCLLLLLFVKKNAKKAFREMEVTN